jgi:hypothetical protein
VTIFDLLFIAIFFTSLAALGGTLFFLFRRRYRRAGRVAAGLAIFLAVYLLLVVGVAVTTPTRYIPLGVDQCFDDFCLAVLKSEVKDSRCAVTVRVSSRARRRVQKAPDAALYLIDGAGREYRESEAGPGRPMTDFLRPGEWFETVRIFTLSQGASEISAVVSHGGGFPGWFIIGERNSFMHKPTVVRLPPG